MGLSLTAVSKNYGYKKDGEGKKGNKRYSDVEIGYIGYKLFRNKLIAFLTEDKISDMDALVGEYGMFKETWYDTKTYMVAVKKKLFDDGEQKKVEVLEYLSKLDLIKKAYPKLYDCFAFIAHCDCEGEMPLEQVGILLPHIKAFYEHDSRNYGYGGRPYNFTRDFIAVCEDVVKNKGKLYFS